QVPEGVRSFLPPNGIRQRGFYPRYTPLRASPGGMLRSEDPVPSPCAGHRYAEFSPAAAPRLPQQQQAVSLQPGLMMPQLSSLRTLFLRLFITDRETEKSIIYGRRRTRFIEGEKANCDVGLN